MVKNVESLKPAHFTIIIVLFLFMNGCIQDNNFLLRSWERFYLVVLYPNMKFVIPSLCQFVIILHLLSTCVHWVWRYMGSPIASVSIHRNHSGKCEPKCRKKRNSPSSLQNIKNIPSFNFS